MESCSSREKGMKDKRDLLTKKKTKKKEKKG
jgi:hypothetical protein